MTYTITSEIDSFQQIVNLFHTSNTFYLVHIDNNVKYAYVNNYFNEKYSPLDNDENNSALTSLHPDDYALAAKINILCRNEPHKSFPATLRKLNRDDGYTITQWDFKANCTEDGGIDGLIGIGYDITDLESKGAQIKFLTSTIRDIMFKQSHVVRKPLANTIGLVDMLQRSNLDANSRAIVKLLKQSCDELTNEFDSFLVSGENKTPVPTNTNCIK